MNHREIADAIRGEMSAMVSVARGRWHRYLELRRWAAEAELACDYPKYRRWTDKAALARRIALRHIEWARFRRDLLATLHTQMETEDA